MAFFEGGIEIWGLGFEFGAAGIHHFVNAGDAGGFAFFVDAFF